MVFVWSSFYNLEDKLVSKYLLFNNIYNNNGSQLNNFLFIAFAFSLKKKCSSFFYIDEYIDYYFEHVLDLYNCWSFDRFNVSYRNIT